MAAVRYAKGHFAENDNEFGKKMLICNGALCRTAHDRAAVDRPAEAAPATATFVATAALLRKQRWDGSAAA